MSAQRIKKKEKSKLHRACENESEPMRTRSKIKPISGARENAIGRVAINFASDWLRGWRQFSLPISEGSKEKSMEL